jgi:Zn-dependent peptidase ImmA (M78 family)
VRNSNDAARVAARELIRRFSLEPPVDVAKLAEVLGFSVDYAPFEDTLSGMYIRERCLIAVNQFHPRARQRFTIAHEIGHATLHTDELFVDQVFFRDGHAAPEKEEVEANRFAAELLMPVEAVKKVIASHVHAYHEALVATLAEKFGVSAQAFAVRLAELGRV